jgi:hypothetical protein
MESEDYLQALETMGKLLLFTPFLALLLLFVSGGSKNNPGLGPETGFSVGLMISAGFFTLVYAAIIRFREGLRKR